MKTSDFDYRLPEELIAQIPLPQRDMSRLLVMDRQTNRIEHRRFQDLGEYLRPGDLLVMNNSRVIPARLFGCKNPAGTRFEILLLEEIEPNHWRVLLRPGKRASKTSKIYIFDKDNRLTNINISVINKNDSGQYAVCFSGTEDLRNALTELGHMPLPPYITRAPNSVGMDDETRYQTVYASSPGSVAAPTAGLHFTQDLLRRLEGQGVMVAWVTLHVGAGTFTPVKTEMVDDHLMHEERFELPIETVTAIQTARVKHRRVIAVGTTTVRVLEGVAAANNGFLKPGCGRTTVFIHPPYAFRVVDALVTNFHLPKSTLLMLVSALAGPGNLEGIGRVKGAYAEAIERRYRFFSYGDAMLIL
ncbi:MAG TPA: tRNA preQ1(34) S-adenosylmethionine ribosyltransferase-isomerase QueA [Candidatus Paceibacterota bacterium]|nr:tRNA preQ1(34) S-adenosylmethionine ribosyltransferase-isomerase QueA [Verrucomicrobiota bacterium]HRY48471.1 tRNA preQ1(34) S-adenosylmethionine ribosyltransferase-isomerase QueA [Candidatus Paceibacterota bacterium]